MKPEEITKLVQTLESAEIQRRLTSLDASVTELGKRHLENHARLITWIFAVVSLIVGGFVISLSILSSSTRADSRAATLEMKNDVKSKLDELDARFQALAGESLKKPFLEITHEQTPLDGQVFTVADGGTLPFFPVILKNMGNKRTEFLSVQLMMTSPLIRNYNGNWQLTATDDKQYPYNYVSSEILGSRIPGIGLAPEESWSIPYEEFNTVYFSMTNEVSCLLKVFYGADKPAEARFTIKRK